MHEASDQLLPNDVVSEFHLVFLNSFTLQPLFERLYPVSNIW